MWWCDICGNGDGHGYHSKTCERYRAHANRVALRIRSFLRSPELNVKVNNPWNPNLPEVKDWHNRINGR